MVVVMAVRVEYGEGDETWHFFSDDGNYSSRGTYFEEGDDLTRIMGLPLFRESLVFVPGKLLRYSAAFISANLA